MAKRGLMAITAVSALILVCPTVHAAMAEPTPREKACAAARADKPCGKDAQECYYKFTVQKAVDAETLKVTYPPSVFSVTDPDMRKVQKEKDYEKEYKDKPFTIHLKSGTAEQDKTYLFTRCPDNKFDLKKEIKPDDPN